jgi:site-specific DNA-methyltransferase (adenine-specific)
MEFMRTLPDKAFQLAIADPPYGISRAGHRRDAKYGWKQFEQKEWDNERPTKAFFDELERVSENRIIWGANFFADMLQPSRGWIVWDKGQRGLDMSDGELAFSSFGSVLRIYTLNRVALLQEGTIHPTQKPVALYAWLLKNYAKPGDRIFDPMMGSQSSRIAAYKMGFDYVGCELDKEYFDKGCERFNRECKGEIKTKDGHIIKQTTLW